MPAFFYGTLIHPKILRAVLEKRGTHLMICPALLKDYTRHEVEASHGADYPGIVPYEMGRKLLDRELEPEESCVRGTLVIGLTLGDIAKLDMFEGSEYTREVVTVYPLEEPTPLEKFIDEDGHLIARIVPAQPVAADDVIMVSDKAGVEAETYIYGDESDLRPTLWSFSEFMSKNAWKWYKGETDRPETEIDRRLQHA
ncbi:hypothetical protein F5887DRAFT_1060045 [Amanita rubescens]|nr:hypothetical protein F5887DRAFT_1060045 [Amanita rubescens]